MKMKRKILLLFIVRRWITTEEIYCGDAYESARRIPTNNNSSTNDSSNTGLTNWVRETETEDMTHVTTTTQNEKKKRNPFTDQTRYPLNVYKRATEIENFHTNTNPIRSDPIRFSAIDNEDWSFAIYYLLTLYRVRASASVTSCRTVGNLLWEVWIAIGLLRKGWKHHFC